MDPLQNHAAMLEEFFQRYGRAEPDECKRLRIQFSKYILALCWQKMFRRITHWSSQVSFQWLSRVGVRELQNAYDECLKAGGFTPSKRADSMLGGLLIGREDAINVWDVITQLSLFQEYYPDIAKLSDAFKAAEALKAGSN